MSEQRFTIQKASGMYLHLPIFDNDVEMADGDVCILLNEQQSTISALKEENEQLEKGKMEALSLLGEEIDKNEQLKNYFKKRAECSNFQINKLKEEIAELQEDNVDTIVELSKENEQLAEENKQLHYKIIELQDKLGMSEKVIDDE